MEKPDYIVLVERQVELAIKAKLFAAFDGDTREHIAELAGIEHAFYYSDILKKASADYWRGVALDEVIATVRKLVDEKDAEDAKEKGDK